MLTISIEEIQRDLGAYLAQVEAGQSLVITRAGKAVAEIKPIAPSSSANGSPVEGEEKRLRPFGLAKGEFVEAEDFDAPLPEDILRLFEGR
jgi:prevent-host-death family protein